MTEHSAGVVLPPYPVLLLLHQLQFAHEHLPLQGSFPAQAGAVSQPRLPGGPQALGRLAGASCSFTTQKCCSCPPWDPQSEQQLQEVTRGLKLCQAWVHPADLWLMLALHPPGLGLCLALGSAVPRDDSSLALTHAPAYTALFSHAVLSILLIRSLLLGCDFQERPPGVCLCLLANWCLRKEMCVVDTSVPRSESLQQVLLRSSRASPLLWLTVCFLLWALVH